VRDSAIPPLTSIASAPAASRIRAICTLSSGERPPARKSVEFNLTITGKPPPSASLIPRMMATMTRARFAGEPPHSSVLLLVWAEMNALRR